MAHGNIQPPPDTPPDQPDRVTATLQVYYEQYGQQPTHLNLAHSYTQDPSDEEPYTRRLSVGPKWTPLDLGWLDGAAGLVVLVNNPPTRATLPTPGEVAADAAVVLEYRVGGGGTCRVRRGLFALLDTDDPAAVEVRVQGGPKAHVTVLVLPRG